MATVQQEREAGRILAEKLASRDPMQLKEAATSIDKFIRKHFTEQSFMDKILEPATLTTDDLHPSLHDDKPYVMLELEPDLPAVASYAFNSTSPMVTFGIKRVLISLDQIRSVRMSKNVNELLTHYVSLRDLNADYLLKQVLRHFDGRGLGCVQRCIGNKPGQVMAASGSVHWHEMEEGLTPHSMAESRKFIPDLYTENGLQSQTLLMNTITFQDFGHWQFQEAGPTIGTEVLKNGLGQFEDGALGLKVIVTIKKKMVKRGAVYHFGDPKYIGRSYVWREPTLHVHQMDDAVSFYVEAMRGGGIYFFGGLVRVDHKGV